MASGSSKSEPRGTRREGVIDWDQYFMGVAIISAQRSKDRETQVGACIVNSNKRIVGAGYNGMPDQGIEGNDDQFSWGKKDPDDEKSECKDYYVCHAEMNAIVNKMNNDIRGCTVYTTLYPCNECSKLMIQSGINRVVFLEEKRAAPKYDASEKLLKTAGVNLDKYQQKGGLDSLLEALKKL